MKYLTLVCFVFIHAFQVDGQDQDLIDSLNQVLNEATMSDDQRVDLNLKIARQYRHSDSVQTAKYIDRAIQLADNSGYLAGQIDAHLLRGWINIYSGYYTYAREQFEKALVLAEKANDFKEQASAYKGIGNSFFYQGDYNAALKQIQVSLSLYKELGDKKSLAKSYNSMAIYLEHQGNYQKSLQYKLLALELAEELSDKFLQARSLNDIGITYINLRNYQLALDYLQQSIKLSKEIGDKEIWPLALTNLGLVHESQGSIDSAFDYYNQALDIFVELGLKRETAFCLNNIGGIYQLKGQYDLALDYLFQSLAIFKETGAKSEVTYPMIIIGQIYRELNRLEEARVYLSDALRISRETDFKLNIRESANQLFQVQKAMGNYQSALESHILFKIMSDSLNNEDNTAAITRMQAEYGFNKERDSVSFANEKEKWVLNQRINSQKNQSYITLIGFTVLLVLLYVLYRYYQSKQKANKLLEAKNGEISRKNRELESLDRAKSHFFANISHELRTPLTLISTPLLSLNDEEFSAESMQKINFVKNNTRKLQSLVDDILELSKLESNIIDINLTDVSALGLLNRIGENFSSMATHLNITYKIDIDFLPDHYIRLDTPKFEKVINNLLSNALKYTPDGGQIYFKAEKLSDSLHISVADTGQGIPEEDLPYIFDRYFQSRQPGVPLQGGTGIGLALAKEYALLMGGELTVRSESGKGSTFLLTLPYEAGQPTKQISNSTTEESGMSTDLEENSIPTNGLVAGNHRVMIVEDHPEMQLFIKKLLQQKYLIVTANNGKQALEKLEKESIDLIISDVMMPEMDGFTLLETLRANDKYSTLPVVMLTALNDEDHKLKALNIGVDEYLAKPFSPKELLARINNMMLRHVARKQAALEEADEEGDDSPSFQIQKEGHQRNTSFIEQVEALILKELENDEFRLDDVSDAFHLGKRQFRRRVKQVTGLTPKEYQREVAMQKARQLLESGVYDNLSAVAYSSGIRNTTRFAQYYESRFGKDPRHYFQDVV